MKKDTMPKATTEEATRRIAELEREVLHLKHSEGTLRKSEEILRAMADSWPALIAYIDTGLRYRFCNAAYETWYQFPRDQMLGKTVEEVWGTAFSDSAQPSVHAVLAGEKQTIEVELPPKDGVQRWVQSNLVPHLDPRGRVQGFFVLASDITERKRIEQALQERLQFEQLVSEISARFVNVAVDQIDCEIDTALQLLGQHFKVDRCAVVQFDADQADLRPTHVWLSDRVDPEQNIFPRFALEQMVKAWQQGEEFIFRRWRDEIPPDQTDKRASVEKIGIKSTLTVPLRIGGVLLGGMGISSFTTERDWPVETIDRLRFVGEIFASALARKQAEERLQQHRAELTHVSRLSTMGEMAAGLAHELNQPLAAIAAYAEGAVVRLEKGTVSPNELMNVVNLIAADAHRAGEVIRHLRQFVRKRPTERLAVDANELIREICQFVRSEAAHRGVTIDVQLADSLPKVQVDAIEIQQVLLNLIRNSFDALANVDPQSRHIRIATRLSSVGKVEVTVEDAGPGIAPDLIDKVVEPFFTSKTDGLGMGLAITRSILEAHQGHIRIGPSTMGGASIYFDLPPVRGG